MDLGGFPGVERVEAHLDGFAGQMRWGLVVTILQ